MRWNSSLTRKLDKDFYKFGKKKENNNLRSFNAFQKPIEFFPPGAELKFYLAQDFILFGEDANPDITPLVFSICASYEFGGQNFIENTIIDLRQYLNSTKETEPIVEELKKIRKTTAKLSSYIEALLRRP